MQIVLDEENFQLPRTLVLLAKNENEKQKIMSGQNEKLQWMLAM